jgi:hypothetical protein
MRSRAISPHLPPTFSTLTGMRERTQFLQKHGNNGFRGLIAESQWEIIPHILLLFVAEIGIVAFFAFDLHQAPNGRHVNSLVKFNRKLISLPLSLHAACPL